MLYLSPFSRYSQNKEKYQKFDLENENQGQAAEERDLRHSSGNARIHVGDFFQNFSYMKTYVYTKGNTHTHTYTHTNKHTQRKTGVMTINSAKQIA